MIEKNIILYFGLFVLQLFNGSILFAQAEVQMGKDDVVWLEKEIKRIPTTRNDKEFMDFLNNKFDEFIKNKADTVMLMYIETTGYGIRNYALMFSKAGMSSRVHGFDKSRNSNHKIATFSIENDTLKSVHINSIYRIFQNDFVRSIDTTGFIAHNDIIYCKFYFGNINKILTGFSGRFFYVLDFLDRRFDLAWRNESLKH